MSIDKALERTGLNLQADALPKEHRNVKTFQRLIAAIRAAEAAVQDDLGKAQAELNTALRVNLELQEQCHKLESALLAHNIKDTLEGIETVSTVDKQRLLEVSAPAAASV